MRGKRTVNLKCGKCNGEGNLIIGITIRRKCSHSNYSYWAYDARIRSVLIEYSLILNVSSNASYTGAPGTNIWPATAPPALVISSCCSVIRHTTSHSLQTHPSTSWSTHYPLTNFILCIKRDSYSSYEVPTEKNKSKPSRTITCMKFGLKKPMFRWPTLPPSSGSIRTITMTR
jgi:hypothetical protein